MNLVSFKLQKVYPGDPRRIQQIALVVEWMEGLPYDKAWDIKGEESKSERSHKQNAYLFGVCYALMEEHSGHEKDELHDICLKRHFGSKEKTVRPSILYPTGIKKLPIRTTTTDESGRRSVLGKMAFAEFVETVRRVGAFMGVVIPDPDLSLVRDEPKRRKAAA